MMLHDVICKEKASKCRRGGSVAFDVLRRLGLQHCSQDPGHSHQEFRIIRTPVTYKQKAPDMPASVVLEMVAKAISWFR